MAFTTSKGMAIGTPAPRFSLPGTDGAIHSLEDFADAKVLVVIFTCNHCPVAQAVEQRLVRLQAEHGPRGAQLVAINANDDRGYPEDSLEKMVARAQERGFNFPYLRDETQEVARAYGAACTPDVFVFGPDRELAYNGRIDDSWKDEAKVTRRDLHEVIGALLDDRAPALPEVVPAMGCSIKWRP